MNQPSRERAFPVDDVQLLQRLDMLAGEGDRTEHDRRGALGHRGGELFGERGVAAHLLWAYYHAVKRRDGAPVQTPEKNGNANAG